MNTSGFLSSMGLLRALSSELSITPLPCKPCSKESSWAENHHLLWLLSICPRELPGMPDGKRGSWQAALAPLRWSL